MAWPGVLKVAFALTLFALFFVAVGYVLPWWFVGKNFYLGVFYGLVCYPGDISGGNCTVFSYQDIKTASSSANSLAELPFFVVLQIITSSVVGLTLLASFILLIGACGSMKSKCPYVLAAIFQFFGALISGLTVGAFAFVYVQTYVSLDDYLTIDGKVFPYSILFFGLGGFILFIAFICLAIATCTWNNMDDDDDDDMNPRYPMNDYSKSGYGNQAYTSDRRNDYVVPSSQKSGYDSRNDYNSSRNDYSSSRNDYSSSRNDYSSSRNDYSSSRNDYSRNDYPSKQEYPYRNDNMYRPYNKAPSRY